MTDNRNPIEISCDVRVQSLGYRDFAEFAKRAPESAERLRHVVTEEYAALESAGYRIVGPEPTEEMVEAAYPWCSKNARRACVENVVKHAPLWGAKE